MLPDRPGFRPTTLKERHPGGVTFAYSPERPEVTEVRLAQIMEGRIPGVRVLTDPVIYRDLNTGAVLYSSPRLDVSLATEALDIWEAIEKSPEFQMISDAETAAYGELNDRMLAQCAWPDPIKARVRGYHLSNYARNQEALVQIAQGKPRSGLHYSSFIVYGKDDSEWDRELHGNTERLAEFQANAAITRQKLKELSSSGVSPLTQRGADVILGVLVNPHLPQSTPLSS